MIPKTTESVLEETALDWFNELGYSVKFGPDIAFDRLYTIPIKLSKNCSIILEHSK